MPRIYTVSFEQALITAVQDLFQVSGAAGKMLRIRRAVLSCSDPVLPASQMLAVRARFLPATVISGSGGGNPTPARTDPGDAAASFVALTNSTTKATTNGSPATLYESGFYLYKGFDEPFDDGVGHGAPLVGPGEAWVLELLNGLIGVVHLSGTVWVEEMGG